MWLTRDYLPEFGQLAAGRPSLAELGRAIGARGVPVLVPWDCVDGFFHACWRRPEAYLRPEVRRGTSVWSRVGTAAESRAVRALRADLASGGGSNATGSSWASMRPTSVASFPSPDLSAPVRILMG